MDMVNGIDMFCIIDVDQYIVVEVFLVVKEFIDFCIQFDYIIFIGMVVIGSFIKRVVQFEIDQVFVLYLFFDFKRYIWIFKEIDFYYIGFIFYIKGFYILVV